MTTDDYILEAAGLHKSFGQPPARVEVLRGLDLRVRRGEFLAVMGPSGCGKSTLLHVLGLMTPPDEGAVLLDGQEAAGLPESRRAVLRRERIGFIFQRFNLLSVLSGIDNLRLAMRIRRAGDERAIRPLLESMGIFASSFRKPGRMSIGQQQRLAVARAVITEPDLLLADEPTGSLDSANADAILQLLRKANREAGQTVVMITHSASAAATADRTVLMKDGKIVEQ